MEISLTLEELMEIYASIKERQIEEFKSMAKANGAEIKGEGEDSDGTDSDAFDNVLNQVRERQGVTPDKQPERKVGLFNINSV